MSLQLSAFLTLLVLSLAVPIILPLSPTPYRISILNCGDSMTEELRVSRKRRRNSDSIVKTGS